MYLQSVNFNMPARDYEMIKDLAHRKRSTLSCLLREGTALVIKKYKTESVRNGEPILGIKED